MRRIALLSAVLLALAVVYLVAWRTQPKVNPAGGASGEQAAVTSVTRSCPPAPPGGGHDRVAMVATPVTSAGKPGQAPPAGTATLSAVPVAPAPAGTARPTASRSATASPSAKAAKTAGKAAKTAGKAATPVTVTATGADLTTAPWTGGTALAATGQMAEGFEAEQANAAGTGLVSCMHPGSDMWFVGTGQAAGASDIRLYLTNTGTLTDTVDVTILTDTGQQNGLSNAITVSPGKVVMENVTPYVHGSQALALHVQASAGQVAAAVWEGGGNGGGAWVPQAAAPSTSLVIPGLTVSRSSARLFVVVPGSADARLKVVAYTPSGAFPQFAATPLDASAGAATPVTLSSLGASAAGLKLTSNVPVVAGVLVPGTGIGSFSAAAGPVTAQGVVAGNPATRGVTVGLLLTAPRAAATASVAVIGADGTVTSRASLRGLSVKAGRTLAVTVPRPPGRKPFAIVVTPRRGSGPLYAARVVTSGSGGLSARLASLLPVPNAPAVIVLPPARNSYKAVLP